MARDANSKRQNDRLQAIQRQYDQEDDEALRVLLATPNGRQVLMRVARDCRWMGDPWDASSVRLTDYESGRRAAGLALMSWAERVSPEQFLLMQQEAQARDVMAAKLKSAVVTESTDGNQEQDDG
jgi:hypothetical protein